jgi:hypothetical protein
MSGLGDVRMIVELTVPHPGTKARPLVGKATSPDSVTSRSGGWISPASHGVTFSVLQIR